MKVNKPLVLASSILPAFSLLATDKGIVDLQVNANSEEFILIPTLDKAANVSDLKFRAVLTDRITGEKLRTAWQAEPVVKVQANLHSRFDVMIEAQDTLSGRLYSAAESNLSVPELLKRKRISPLTQFQRHADQSTVSSLNWANSFSIDAEKFPSVLITADLSFDNKVFDGSEGNLPLLDTSNISLREDGRVESIDRLVQPDANSARRIVDIVFVHDDSGSLNDEAAQVRANILSFVSELQQQNFDFRLGLLPYGGGGGFSDSNGTLLNNGSLTGDPAVFQSLIDQMQFDGSREQAFDAMQLASTASLWRPNTQKVLILVTDEDNDSGSVSESEITSTLIQNNIIFYGLTDGDAEFNRIATAASGRIFDVRSDFSSILQEIGTDLASRYQVQYETDNTLVDGTERTVTFSVDTTDADNNVVQGNFDITYTPIVPIDIMLTQATQALFGEGLLPEKAVTIESIVVSDVALTGVQIGYRHSTDADFTITSMTQQAGGLWTAEIPEGTMREGNVEFYISALTENAVKTLPSSDPEETPFVISVLPNIPPEIFHQPVLSATIGQDILIEGSAEDASNEVTEFQLYYRQFGAPIFDSITVGVSGQQANFSEVIPGSSVTDQGVEYYLVALDDFQTSSSVGTADAPIFITTEDEIPAGCNDFNNVMVCADEFLTNENTSVVTASGSVQLGKSGGSPVLGFSGAVTVDPVTNDVNSLGPARLKALGIDFATVTSGDINLANTGFSVDGNASDPILRPPADFDYQLNNILLGGKNIDIKERRIDVDSDVKVPFISDFSVANAQLTYPVSLGDIILSQDAGASSAEVTVNVANLGLAERHRVGKFGNSGLSIGLDTLTFDLLQPGISGAGTIRWNQSELQLGAEFALSPVAFEAFSFEAKRLRPALGRGFPLGATGFVIIPSSVGGEWRELPQPQMTVSTTGVFSDAAGAVYNIGNRLGKDILSGKLALTISNGAKTWEGSGNLSLLEAIDLASTKLTLGLLSQGQYGAELRSRLNLLDIVIGNLLLNAQTGSNFTQFRSNNDLTFQFPSYLYIVGGTRLLSGDTELLVKIPHGGSNEIIAFVQAIFGIGGLDVGVRLDFSDPNNLDFDIIDKGTISGQRIANTEHRLQGIAEYVYTIEEAGTPTLLNVIATSGVPQLELVAPDGTIYGEDAKVSMEQLSSVTDDIFYFDNGENQATFVLTSPDAGEYTLRTVNDDQLTEVESQQITPLTSSPVVANVTSSSASAGDTLEAVVALSNESEQTEVEFYLVNTSSPESGISIGTQNLADGENQVSLDIPANLAPGEYHLQVTSRPEAKLITTTTAPGDISISNASAPALPGEFAVQFGNAEANLSWTYNDPQSIEYFAVQIVDLSNGNQWNEVLEASQTTATIGGLSNGNQYAISIAAIDINDLLSGYTSAVTGTPSGSSVTGAPDLGFVDDSILLTSESGNIGEPISISATIQNDGQFPAYASRFSCYYGSVSEQNQVSSTLLGNINAGASLEVQCTIDQSLFPEASDSIFMLIDEAVLEETNLTNNTALVENPFAQIETIEFGVDDDVSTDEDVPILIDVLANDTEDGNLVLEIGNFTQPQLGTVALQDGQLLYTPNANVFGTDSFTYEAFVGEDTSGLLNVNITINPVNDMPVIEVTNSISISEGTSQQITAQASDIEGDPLTFTWIENGSDILQLQSTDAETVGLSAPYVSGEQTVMLQVQVDDGSGPTIADVEVTILNDNTGPSIIVSGPDSVDAGAEVALSWEVNDEQGDAVNVSYNQTSGTAVTISETDNGIAFTAPESETASVIEIEFTAADAELSTTVIKQVNVAALPAPPPVTPPVTPPADNDSSGGAFGSIYGALLMLLTIFKRRGRKSTVKQK